LAAAVVQLDGSVLIWHMIEWFLTACCKYRARSKSEHAHYSKFIAWQEVLSAKFIIAQGIPLYQVIERVQIWCHDIQLARRPSHRPAYHL
jgi:hypothetical protein